MQGGHKNVFGVWKQYTLLFNIHYHSKAWGQYFFCINILFSKYVLMFTCMIYDINIIIFLNQLFTKGLWPSKVQSRLI